MSTINLLPDDYMQRRANKRANALCLALFVLVMVGVLAAHMASMASHHNTELVLNQIDDDYAEGARLINELRTLDSQEAQLSRRADLTTSLIERVPRSTLLAIVAQAMPEYSCLTQLEIKMEQVENSAPTAGRQTRFAAAAMSAQSDEADEILVLIVTGLAMNDVDVSRIISTLARNPLLQGVDLVYSEEIEIDESHVLMREFQIRAELQPGADAIMLNPDAIRTSAAPQGASEGSQT